MKRNENEVRLPLKSANVFIRVPEQKKLENGVGKKSLDD